MEDESEERIEFEGYHLSEDSALAAALERYKEADERVWTLTRKYLYPPEEVPHEGQRELVFPNVAARDEYEEAKRVAREAEEKYQSIARERQKREGSGA
ncbi:MAG: hypothetical protein JXA58_02535 [Dehalococcoidia bacterium]|nr:hypothetical protein [Dehalococcoidia bacterium]